MSEKKIQRAAILMEYDGSISYYDWDNPDKLLLTVGASCEYSDVHDHRQPPFIQILPCPYCGVLEDREHDPRLHVNKKLGTPNADR